MHNGLHFGWWKQFLSRNSVDSFNNSQSGNSADLFSHSDPVYQKKFKKKNSIDRPQSNIMNQTIRGYSNNLRKQGSFPLNIVMEYDSQTNDNQHKIINFQNLKKKQYIIQIERFRHKKNNKIPIVLPIGLKINSIMKEKLKRKQLEPKKHPKKSLNIWTPSVTTYSFKCQTEVRAPAKHTNKRRIINKSLNCNWKERKQEKHITLAGLLKKIVNSYDETNIKNFQLKKIPEYDISGLRTSVYNSTMKNKNYYF